MIWEEDAPPPMVTASWQGRMLLQASGSRAGFLDQILDIIIFSLQSALGHLCGCVFHRESRDVFLLFFFASLFCLGGFRLFVIFLRSWRWILFSHYFHFVFVVGLVLLRERRRLLLRQSPSTIHVTAVFVQSVGLLRVEEGRGAPDAHRPVI